MTWRTGTFGWIAGSSRAARTGWRSAPRAATCAQRSTIEVAGDRVVLPLTEESRLSDVLEHPVAGPLLRVALTAMQRAAFGGRSPEQTEGMEKMLESMPIGRMVNFPGTSITREILAKLIAASLPRET